MESHLVIEFIKLELITLSLQGVEYLRENLANSRCPFQTSFIVLHHVNQIVNVIIGVKRTIIYTMSNH